ncbi:NACHT domain-containing protein [Streptomyces kunmingensis]|uniref:NACHT domain-containing protein n=1 Tax=Streptomyces kunmingensis TaxID=68225 RepID=A0ABU6CKY1_9ACTN|nr:NACHT domain-containing protein [Streptomyces kunmingensis]MEB3965384.1 NACHT domain-containing protein [Streptomyces kunmingensis]
MGLRIASAVVVPLLKRLVLPPAKAPGAEFTERPVRIRHMLSFVGDHPTVSRDDLHRLARELVRRAVRAAGPHERPIEDDEHDAVGQALTRTLYAFGELDMDDVRIFLLGPEKLAAALSRQAGPDTRRLLTRDAALFHDRLLETACVHLVQFFTQRPGFEARARLEDSRELREVHTKLDVVLRRVSGDDHEAFDGRFEESYARYVGRRHGRLTIYGVDLRDPGGQEWPLESAYLSLRAVATPVPDDDTSDPPDDEPATEREESVEAALATRGRVLLHGLAGTGKTTLVQWLALTTAQQDSVPGHLPQLLGRVPFVLPLRTLAREGAQLPLPEDFLRWMDCPLVGTEPDGWATRVLQNGRGLLLIDGLDEIPKADRTRTRTWLRELLAVFPGNLWLVTTRPSALGPGWLSGEGFHEITLDALRPGDLRHFIRRWHTAAGARPGLDEELIQSLRAGPGLSRLATNPLMCSLICALHRERRGFLPRGRAALYKAALSMLLERRDMERELFGRSGAPELDEEAATEPLKRLAYWLIRNERTQIERDDAVDVVRRLQPQVPSLDNLGEPEDALQYLLERSGLLREPAAGALDFVHRTFQDYLGAKAVLEERDFGMLVKNAHVDQWEDVVQMAVAQADHNGRADLLMRLSDRGNREKDATVQARLRLLALASLEQATRLEPAVRRTIETEAARMLPPRSLRQARVLARTGPLLLGLLPGADELDGDEELATVHAICQIGGDAAIPRLREFLTTGQSAVRAQLLGHWDRFDTDTYADEIIRPLLATTPEEPVTVRSAAELAALATMPGCERVGVHGDFDPAAIRAALDPGRLRELRLRGAPRLDDLAVLDDFGALEELTLQSCRNLTDPAPLTRLPRLRSLTLADLPQFEPLSDLAGCAGLDALHVGAEVPWRGTVELPYLDRLRTLALPPGTVELGDIARGTKLTELRLHEAGDKLLPDDWGKTLAAVETLRTLTLSPEQLSVLLFGQRAEISAVTHLYVYAKPGAPVSLRRIARRLPNLVELHLTQGTDIDLSSLKAMSALRRVRLAYSRNVSAAEHLPAGVDLEIYPHP